MLRIDRIRIEIQTGEGLYGFDERLYDGLNFLASIVVLEDMEKFFVFGNRMPDGHRHCSKGY